MAEEVEEEAEDILAGKRTKVCEWCGRVFHTTYREKHYKTYHWKPIFIWGTDLLREDAEEFVLGILHREGAIKNG